MGSVTQRKAGQGRTEAGRAGAGQVCVRASPFGLGSLPSWCVLSLHRLRVVLISPPSFGCCYFLHLLSVGMGCFPLPLFWLALLFLFLLGGCVLPPPLGGAFSSLLWVVVPFANIVLWNAIQLHEYNYLGSHYIKLNSGPLLGCLASSSFWKCRLPPPPWSGAVSVLRLLAGTAASFLLGVAFLFLLLLGAGAALGTPALDLSFRLVCFPILFPCVWSFFRVIFILFFLFCVVLHVSVLFSFYCHFHLIFSSFFITYLWKRRKVEARATDPPEKSRSLLWPRPLGQMRRAWFHCWPSSMSN